MANVSHLLARPAPPQALLSPELSSEGVLSAGSFMPSPDLLNWIRTAYLDESGRLYTAEHSHLTQATIGCLWTNVENTRQARIVVGQAEIPANTYGRSGKWPAGRARQQIEEWFGDEPDFLLTFDAIYADAVDDGSFCALVDHELFHCGQALDEFGQPRFRKNDGLPVWTIRGHDVEEFAGVVRRFGLRAAGENVQEFVDAAMQRPEISTARLAQACGTCIRAVG